MPVVQKSNKTPEWVEGSVTFVKADCLPPKFWGSGQFLAMRDSGPFYERHHITSKAIRDPLLFPRQKCPNIGTVQYEVLAIYPPPPPIPGHFWPGASSSKGEAVIRGFIS